MQLRLELRLSGMAGMVFRWQEKSWNKEHVFLQNLTHQRPASICYLGPLWVSLRQKLHSINLLLQNAFKHSKYKKEECHEPYISSFGINNYKTNLLVPQVVIDQRLCNIKVVDNWVPSEDILDLYQVFLFLLCSHLWREGGRGRIREKKRERLISSWRTAIKTPCQLACLPKALLPNTITLGVKGEHSSIHSSYADLFLNQDRPSFHSLLLLIHFSWSVLWTRWTFHKIYIMSIWGKMIGCEKNALLFPIKWTFNIQSMYKFPWFSKSRCLLTVYWKSVLICCTCVFPFKTK